MQTIFRKTALEIFNSAKNSNNLITDKEQIRTLSETDKTTLTARPWSKDVYSSWGCPVFVTKLTARSPDSTKIIWEASEEHAKLLQEVKEYLAGKQLIAMDRQMGMAENHSYFCRTLITKEYARLAHMWKSLLLPVSKTEPLLPEGKEPDTLIISIPEWGEVKGKQIILVDPNGSTTFSLGFDYVGEVKKGHLRMAMYNQKMRYKETNGKLGGLGMHAGAKLARMRDASGKLVEKGFVFFGLSATGKTTHTFHHWWLDETNGEQITIKQDDFGTLTKDGRFIGTEQGCYLKLDGLARDSQQLLYDAVRNGGKRVSLENVYVDKETNEPDFNKFEHFYTGRTTNSRGVIPSTLFGKYFDENSIDLEYVDAIFFITRRNSIIPAITKLVSPEQAAAFFVLGESVHSSASTSDPNKIGQSIRCVGTNPFIVGSEAEEGNIFLEMIESINSERQKAGKQELEIYLLNTGSVGAVSPQDKGIKLTIEDSVNSIKAIAKGGVEWVLDEQWGYMVPKELKELTKTSSTLQSSTMQKPTRSSQKTCAQSASRGSKTTKKTGSTRK
ncbi:MAG: phosphoenolpyruvate carboxykinase (ATP) [Candidatus Micrarchaeota archaeon]